jgi:hypothetical protein
MSFGVRSGNKKSPSKVISKLIPLYKRPTSLYKTLRNNPSRALGGYFLLTGINPLAESIT